MSTIKQASFRLVSFNPYDKREQSSEGEKASDDFMIQVFGINEKGETCSNTNCKTKIIKSTSYNRTTFFCSNCQK